MGAGLDALALRRVTAKDYTRVRRLRRQRERGVLSLSGAVPHNHGYMLRSAYSPPGPCRRGMPSWAVLGVAAALAATVGGCASGGDTTGSPGLTFGDSAGMTAAMTASASSADDGGTGGDATQGGDATDSPTGGSGGTMDGNGSADDNGASAGTADVDDGAGTAGQPDNGMFSDCLTTAECVGVNTCITIFDDRGAPFDGFCTKDNCVDPAADCVPSPGGTAAVVCTEVQLMKIPASVCALDCADGLVCPDGMVCYEDAGVPVCM